jgi:phosphomethylpyrimidine synthase
MTQIEAARKKRITPQMRSVAKEEGTSLEKIRKGLTEGKIIIPHNRRHKGIKLCGLGKDLRTKVNANIGTSPEQASLKEELKKLKAALSAGADTIMDLSVGGDISRIRKEILAHCPVPLGTVPLYQAAVETAKKRGSVVHMTVKDIFKVIEKQAEEGVDFMTLHCGVTRNTLERLRLEGRLTDIVSRGGSFLVTWMVYNKKENPLYENYEDLLDIAREYDVTLSLGDGLRPGSLADATDRPQVQELITLGELTERAWKKGVQVMIEGPGHIPLKEIEANVLLEKKLCREAPFYVLGPLVTDVAPGYDHITSAIGGAIAAGAGADFLCYVTPSEHLRLPTVEDVKEGVIATRIAAHTGDLTKGIKGALDWDYRMSKMRKKLKWKEQIRLALDPERPKEYRKSSKPRVKDVCTMCGEYCALKQVEEYLKK